MKVAFINFMAGLPIPSTMGGGSEELLTILLNENEKSSGENEFYFFQKELYGKDKKYKTENKYKNSKLIFVKYNRFVNFLQRALSKVLKLLKIKKDFPTYFPLNYHKKVFKQVKKVNPDIIIFEGQIDANINKYIKEFGKEKLFMHLHIQDLEKVKINNYVSGIISVSDFVKNDYEKFIGKESKTMKNFVLKNCVDEDRFSKKISAKERENTRKALGFSKDDFVVCYCGRICEDKGVDKLIDAVLKTEEKVKLLIIGGFSSVKKKTTPYIKMIQKTVEENNDRIKYTGYIKNKELYRYYQSSDLQVVPSMWEEAAGLVVIEGQLCGVPQIITKSGGMVDYASEGTIILDRFNNFTDKLASEIEFLSNNPKKLVEIRDAGYENVKGYKKNSYYKNFVDILDRIKKGK